MELPRDVCYRVYPPVVWSFSSAFLRKDCFFHVMLRKPETIVNWSRTREGIMSLLATAMPDDSVPNRDPFRSFLSTVCPDVCRHHRPSGVRAGTCRGHGDSSRTRCHTADRRGRCTGGRRTNWKGFPTWHREVEGC